MENYFNYFTEIEEHFQRRRGSALLLSTLDWALIETWKDAGIPLAAVLRGIDDAFEKYQKRRSRSQKVNGLAYCSQAVFVAAEAMKEAATGAPRQAAADTQEKGFQGSEIAMFLQRCADALEQAQLPERGGAAPQVTAQEVAAELRDLAAVVESSAQLPPLEDLERRLKVWEDKLYSLLLAATQDEEVVTVRAEADRELDRYRRKMPAAQIDQLINQYIHKRLLEKYKLPRLSLFYM